MIPRGGAALSALAVQAVLAGLLGVAPGCARHPVATPAPGAWDYEVTPPPAGSWSLGVEATLEGAPADRLVIEGSADAIKEIALAEGGGTMQRRGDAWVAPACRTRCRVRYVVDLQALAAGCRRLDCTRRVGDAVLGQASAWMLRPEPEGTATVHLRVRGDASARFATGLRSDGQGGYVLSSSQLGEASYTALGAIRATAVDVPGARLHVVLLGEPLHMGDPAVLAWIRDAAACVARLFERFPVDATIFVVPVPGADEVVFGRVMSLSGASVVLLFGADAVPENAPHDWVVVHELFHLGCPSFVGEGHWLEEGLATYYEPILRERAGWRSEADLWSEFVHEMPRGLRKEGTPASLEERDDIDSTYWGGAIFALLADIRIRRATSGARSLDDALRAVLAQHGDATHEASVADFLRSGDRAVGVGELSEVHEQWAVRGMNADLEALWQSLGIEAQADGGVLLHDDAPLAGIRRAIAAGTGH
jgi:predicted metalloprotease with PDZ domain